MIQLFWLIAYISLLLAQEARMNSNEKVHIYKKNLLTKEYLFTMTVTGPSEANDLVLFVSDREIATMKINTLEDLPASKDIQGYSIGRSQQYIRFFASSATLNYGIFRMGQNEPPIDYKIDVVESTENTCPNSCSNKGKCNNGTCTCFATFMDVDCSQCIQFNKLQEYILVGTTSVGISVEPRKWLFVANRASQEQPLTVTSDAQGISVLQMASTMYSPDTKYRFPIPGILSDTVQFTSNSNQTITIVNPSFQKPCFDVLERSGERSSLYIVVSYFNPSRLKTVAYLSMEESEPDEGETFWTYETTVLFIFSAVFTVSIVFGLYQCYNIKRAIAQLLPEQDFTLGTNYLDSYMPSQKFRNLTLVQGNNYDSKIPTECPICLISFGPEDLCRMTYCFHMFHSQCLEQWILSKASCPCCRMGLDEATLKTEHSNFVVRKQNNMLTRMNRAPSAPIGDLDSPELRRWGQSNWLGASNDLDRLDQSSICLANQAPDNAECKVRRQCNCLDFQVPNQSLSERLANIDIEAQSVSWIITNFGGPEIKVYLGDSIELRF